MIQSYIAGKTKEEINAHIASVKKEFVEEKIVVTKSIAELTDFFDNRIKEQKKLLK